MDSQTTSYSYGNYLCATNCGVYDPEPVYEFSIVPNPPTGFILINTNTKTISWAGATVTDVGSYNISLSASINEEDASCSSSHSFELTIVALCEWTETTNFDIIPSSMTDQIYNVTDKTGTTTLIVTPFKVSGDTSCNSTDVEYVSSVKVLESTNSDTSWITFDPENLLFSWTAEASNVGVYRVKLRGTINNRQTEKYQ